MRRWSNWRKTWPTGPKQTGIKMKANQAHATLIWHCCLYSCHSLHSFYRICRVSKVTKAYNNILVPWITLTLDSLVWFVLYLVFASSFTCTCELHTLLLILIILNISPFIIIFVHTLTPRFSFFFFVDTALLQLPESKHNMQQKLYQLQGWYCGVTPIILVWLVSEGSIHALVFIQKTFLWITTVYQITLSVLV